MMADEDTTYLVNYYRDTGSENAKNEIDDIIARSLAGVSNYVVLALIVNFFADIPRFLAFSHLVFFRSLVCDRIRLGRLGLILMRRSSTSTPIFAGETLSTDIKSRMRICRQSRRRLPSSRRKYWALVRENKRVVLIKSGRAS